MPPLSLRPLVIINASACFSTTPAPLLPTGDDIREKFHV
jgi:hypothetical protein